MTAISDKQVAIQDYLSRMNDACDKVISWVFEHGTLAQFPRVTEYLSKENGGSGWEDSYQNFLITRLCSSRWFEKFDKAPNLYRCIVDGSVWYRSSYEWRMNAYKETLICNMPPNEVNTSLVGALPIPHATFFSNDFFRTDGFAPSDAQVIDIDFFVYYLTNLTDGGFETLSPSIEKHKESESIWRKLLNVFRTNITSKKNSVQKRLTS